MFTVETMVRDAWSHRWTTIDARTIAADDAQHACELVADDRPYPDDVFRMIESRACQFSWRLDRDDDSSSYESCDRFAIVANPA